MLTDQRLRPITQLERIQIVDVLRGVAVWGILMVNINVFSYAWFSIGFEASLDSTLGAAITEAFFFKKFYSLFSFMFGLGMSIQMMRAEQKNAPFIGLYLRRLLWLFVFGAIHQVLIWEYDILALYAFIALLALPLRKLKPRVLLIIGAALIVIHGIAPLFDLGERGNGVDLIPWLAEDDGPVNFDEAAYNNERTYVESVADRLERWWVTDIVSDVGTLAQKNVWNSLLAPLVVLRRVFESVDILGLFLIGIAFGKLGLLHDVEGHLDLWWRFLLMALPAGLVASIGAVLLFNRFQNQVAVVMWDFLLTLFAPVLSLGYMSGVVIASRKAKWLSLFAPLGRMALTNYLMHSVVFTLAFSSYGLGLAGQVGMMGGLLLATGMIAIQIVLSHAWLAVFRFGPLEWLWRSLTYGSIQPLRKGQPELAA